VTWRRRHLVLVTGAIVAIAGCGGSGLAGAPTPPPTAFKVSTAGDQAVELRYTGIGSQDPTRFRVVLTGGGSADGVYKLKTIAGVEAWTDADRIVLNQTTLGLADPLTVDGLTVRLQYRDEGEWLTILTSQPGD